MMPANAWIANSFIFNDLLELLMITKCMENRMKCMKSHPNAGWWLVCVDSTIKKATYRSPLFAYKYDLIWSIYFSGPPG